MSSERLQQTCGKDAEMCYTLRSPRKIFVQIALLYASCKEDVWFSMSTDLDLHEQVGETAHHFSTREQQLPEQHRVSNVKPTLIRCPSALLNYENFLIMKKRRFYRWTAALDVTCNIASHSQPQPPAMSPVGKDHAIPQITGPKRLCQILEEATWHRYSSL